MVASYPLEIFYDGSCIVCATEIETYRKNNPQNRLRFIDVSDTSFEAERYGKSAEEFMARMHVRDGDGFFYAGVDAFLAIWQAYPPFSLYRLLAWGISLPGIKLAARAGYAVFARYRYLLPKRRNDCAGGTCQLGPRGKSPPRE